MKTFSPKVRARNNQILTYYLQSQKDKKPHNVVMDELQDLFPEVSECRMRQEIDKVFHTRYTMCPCGHIFLQSKKTKRVYCDSCSTPDKIIKRRRENQRKCYKRIKKLARLTPKKPNNYYHSGAWWVQ